MSRAGGFATGSLELAKSHPSADADWGALETAHGGHRRRGALLGPALGDSRRKSRPKRSTGEEREVTRKDTRASHKDKEEK